MIDLLNQGASDVAAPSSGHPGSAQEWAARITAEWNRAHILARTARSLRAKLPSREMLAVELPLARKLKEDHGHHIRRQVPCPNGRVDIVDYDELAIFECKADGGLQSLFDAAKQLKRYEPHFPGKQLWIAVPQIEDESRWLANAFRAIGIQILQVDLEP